MVEKLEHIVEQLIKLGFYENDAKVYVALLEFGEANPTDISKKTDIVRARVYDSLGRLEEKGYVKHKGKAHGRLYSAVEPDKVLSKIRNDLTDKLSISEQLAKQVLEKVKIAPNMGTWSIKGTSKIKAKIRNIISQTDSEFSALITPDFAREKWLFELILEKARGPTKISIGLKIETENVELVKKLLEKGVAVYHWNFTDEMPLGIYTSDSKNTLITIVGSWKTYLEHNIGFLIQGSDEQHKGFEFLIQWFFSSCKKGEEIIKNLNV